MRTLEKVHASWMPLLSSELHQEPLKSLGEKILPNISYQPAKENIFKVFSMPVEDIKMVILGQDPYPRPGDAIGRAFGTSERTKIPVSLKNIKKEIVDSEIPSVKLGENVSIKESLQPYVKHIELEKPNWRTLEHWEKQGVFLLNTALTVETGKAGSHLKEWEAFTKKVIAHIAKVNPCVWMLWGKKAQSFIPYINPNIYPVKGYSKKTIEEIPISEDYNYVISAPHPAAEAYAGGKAGFFGSNCFYFANKIIENKKLTKISW